MNDKRLAATRFIWGILALLLMSVIVALALSGSTLEPAGSILIGLLIVAAATSTIAIWKAPANDLSSPDKKAKRGDRIANLMARLDDDEMYELRERLARSHELEDTRTRLESWYDDESFDEARR